MKRDEHMNLNRHCFQALLYSKSKLVKKKYDSSQASKKQACSTVFTIVPII